ncbi:MAG: hypothetical protein IKZ14_00435 [Muribaculaceae bacterium]|nr:hypothetical protein [Muribaculaceae bacterium]
MLLATLTQSKPELKIADKFFEVIALVKIIGFYSALKRALLSIGLIQSYDFFLIVQNFSTTFFREYSDNLAPFSVTRTD